MLRQTADCECHGSCESHDISAGLFAITLWQNQAKTYTVSQDVFDIHEFI